MAPRAAKSTAPKPKARKKVAKAVRGKPKPHKLPPPITKGEIVTDMRKRQWRIGSSIGTGGFGEIYSAADVTENNKNEENYVIKIEPHSNGPLFSEMNFYMRAAKSEDIDDWISRRKMAFLGMPRFIASGSHNYKNEKYRFLVMERFGTDIQKKLDENDKKLPLKTIYTIASRVIDVLQYIHSKDYVHADVKASNLLLGYGKGKENDVFLADFGLACKYIIDGKHKEYKEDPKRSHDGTIEFISRDGHIGAFSRRGDLEILAYNMIQWSCGRLPWEEDLEDCNLVKELKNNYMDDVPWLMKDCYNGKKAPDGIVKFISAIVKLSFDEEPDYEKLKNLLKKSLETEGCKNDGLLDFNKPKILGKRSSFRKNDNVKKPSSSPSSVPKRKKPLRVKNNSPEIFKDDDSDLSLNKSLSPVQTAAMIKIKQMMADKEKKLNGKKKKTPTAQKKSRTDDKVKKERATKASKNRTSPRFNNSFSPEV